MTRSLRQRRSAAGTTLVELLIVLAISSVLVALVVLAMIDMDRTRRPRELTAQLQGQGRDGLSALEADLRAAALGAPTGVVVADLGGRVARPAVQIFDAVGGGGDFLAVKAGTDALLLVRAEISTAAAGGEFAVLTRDHFASTTLDVSDPVPFGENVPVLYGEYSDGIWDVVKSVAGNTLTMTAGANLLPQRGGKVQRLAAGAFVRRAHARLYYVTPKDELVRAELRTPRAPQSADDVESVTVLARGVENLQIDCAAQAGMALGACPAPKPADGLSTEAEAALGKLGDGGARVGIGDAPNLRTVWMTVLVRSAAPLSEGRGDPAIKLANEGEALAPGGGPAGEYLRRSYRIGLAIRNTSLEVL